MKIAFDYLVTFQDGRTVNRHDRRFPNFSDEEFRLIVKGLVAGYEFAAIPDIEPILTKLNENVELGEQYLSINGVFLEAKIKKPRVIMDIEYAIPSDQLNQLLAFRDHMEQLDRPEDSMTIYRNDGSCVTIKSKFGKVWLTDSRRLQTPTTMEADYFLSRVL